MRKIILLFILGLISCNLFAQRIEKDFIYDQHTLADTYPYKDTVREFQWDKIREQLKFLDSLQSKSHSWAVLQNRKNINGRPELAKNTIIDDYSRVQDAYGTQQYQTAPLYSLDDLETPERYGRDGSLVRIIGEDEDNYKIETTSFEGQWSIPKKYVKPIDTDYFGKVIFVDRTNQNITTLEKSEEVWLVRSMNPATTGLHRPPYQMETPKGIFVIQDKQEKMLYYRDGTDEIGGFSPHASRFSQGAYIHGVPINLPDTEPVEFSATLGTTPRSHMCVRNATSHALFVYEWAPTLETLVFVFD